MVTESGAPWEDGCEEGLGSDEEDEAMERRGLED